MMTGDERPDGADRRQVTGERLQTRRSDDANSEGFRRRSSDAGEGRQAEERRGQSSGEPAAAKKGGIEQRRVTGMGRGRRKTDRIVKRKPNIVIRAGQFLLILVTGAAFLGAFGWWGYTQIMKQVLGRFDLFDWRQSAVGIIAESEVILLHPFRTEEYLNSFEEDTLAEWPYRPRPDDWPRADTNWYAQEVHKPEKVLESAWQQLDLGAGSKPSQVLEYWRDRLFKERLSYQVLQEPDLVNILRGRNVLIIPGAVLLSAEEKRAIKDFLASGGRVLACWSLGSRDERGEWVGTDFLSQITGGLPAKVLEDSAGSTSIVLKRNSPITAMIPAGSHLDILTYNGYFTLDLLEPRTVSDGFRFDPYWKDEGAYIEPRRNCAIVHGTYLDGKFVWLTFMPETVQQNENNPDIIDRIIINSLAWLREDPLVDARVWPVGYNAGAAMVLDARGSSALISRAVNIGINSDLRFDLLIEGGFTPIGLNFSDLAKGNLILYSQETQALLQVDADAQKRWFKNQAERIEEQFGKAPVGFHPADWQMTPDLLRSASRAGFRYILGDNRALYYGSRYEMVKSGSWRNLWRRSPILLYPKSELTMREWFALRGKSGDELIKAMENEVQRLAFVNGLYVGIFDAELMTDEKTANLPVKLSQTLDSLGYWRAPLKDVMERYSAWTGIRVNPKKISPGRVRINISNSGRFTITNVTFKLYYRSDFDGAAASSEVVGVAPVDVQWDKASGVCTFIMPILKPRENLSVFIDFTKT